MIKRLKVTGYKSLKDVEVHFQPLSIMFGPNAAGKSNLLDALSLISGIVTRKNLKDAFGEQRGLPLESFYYGDEGFERLTGHSGSGLCPSYLPINAKRIVIKM
jgi:AAA15 family ATPase/GTPase